MTVWTSRFYQSACMALKVERYLFQCRAIEANYVLYIHKGGSTDRCPSGSHAWNSSWKRLLLVAIRHVPEVFPPSAELAHKSQT